MFGAKTGRVDSARPANKKAESLACALIFMTALIFHPLGASLSLFWLADFSSFRLTHPTALGARTATSCLLAAL